MTAPASTAQLPDPKALIAEVSMIAEEAGAAILKIYATDFEARTKEDSSPVTDADEAAEAIIAPALKRLTPEIPVVAEEAAAAGDVPDVGDGPFWLVDPLDGTKEFLNRNGEFTVNIALIADHKPVLGVVLAPAIETLYRGIAGQGAERRVGAEDPAPIAVREPPADGLTVIASRRHGDPEEIGQFLKGRAIAEMTNAGSSLKFCKVAAGEADLYPRFGRTMEWDTAAGQAVLEAAGGAVTETDGTPFRYAKNAIFENPHFVAWGGLRP
jgi:3'(2'), 5'-bisphosphate nucleotidase